MKFYKLANGYIEEESRIKSAFLITTGLSSDREPYLYSQFLFGLSNAELAVEVFPTVEELCVSGNTVYAAALYREEFGCTLLEARKHITEIMERPRYQ